MNKLPFWNRKEVQNALDVLIESGQVFEIRILEPKKTEQRWIPKVLAGYFDNKGKAIEALQSLNLESAKGIYVTLNPIEPSLLARSCNKFMESKGSDSTADKNIIARRWLLIDCDPQRPSGISASDEEKELSYQRILGVEAFLEEQGWPEPVLADSGNGFHLLYRIDLPADSDQVEKCLEALAHRFSDNNAKIDVSVHNPARILKLYGTSASKGDHCPDINRPHRMSKILRQPELLEVVPTDLLSNQSRKVEDASTSLPQPEHRLFKANNKSMWNRQGVESFIHQYLSHCNPGKVQIYEDGYKWVLAACPFNPAHTNHSAVITYRGDGIIGFRCLHDGCRGHDWKALRAKFEPSYSSFSGKEQAKQPDNEFDESDAVLVQKYGEPIFYNKNNEPSDVNQQFIAAKFEQENLILFDPITNTFYAYDDATGLWKPKTESSLIKEIGLMLRNVLKKHRAENLLRKRTENLVKQILGFLRGIVEKQNAFEGEKEFIHVGNGVLHFEDHFRTLRTFSPDYLSRNRSEIHFDPQATCPRFLNELLRQALSEDDISLLQRYAGQCLLGRNLSQTILLLRGTPGGGKSTLLNVLETIIGIFNVMQLRIEHLSDRFEMASYVGKTLLCGKDVPGDFLNHKSAYVLKALVGNDRLNAEQKNARHRFEIYGRFNVIITSNSRLHVRLDSDAGAWKRRLLIIDYERPATEKPNPRFAEELIMMEGPGILNWMIEGAIILKQELDPSTLGKIQLTEPQRKRIDDLLCESDSVRQFVQERVIKSENASVTVHELTTAYNDFCDDKGWQALSVRQFENQLANVMMEIHRVVRRNDIKRNNTTLKGFMHVALQ